MTEQEIKAAQETKAAAEAVRDETLKRIKDHEEVTGKALADLTAVTAEIKKQVETKGAADPELKEKHEKMWARLDEIDAKLSAPANGGSHRATEVKSIFDRLEEREDLKDWTKTGFVSAKNKRFGWDGIAMAKGDLRKAVNPFFAREEMLKRELKSIITVGGLGTVTPTTEALWPARLPGIIQLQRRELRIRDLLRTQAVTGPAVTWLKQLVFTNSASPQTEGATKAESTITYVPATTSISTIAHWIQTTRQALDDFPGLREDIDDTMMYGLKLREDSELLAGDGLGTHIYGLIPQATAYSGAGLTTSGDTRLDTLRHGILEARRAEFPVDGIVLNPDDVHWIELIKDQASNVGNYVVGQPQSGTQPLTLWGRPVVETMAIAAGKFLVGAFSMGAILFDRMTATIDISLENGTNFVENEATILAEERIGLGVVRPAAFRYGSF